MKRVLFITLTVLLCSLLAGCSSKEIEKSSDTAPEIIDSGAWIEAEDETIAEEHTAMFEKAQEGYTGASFKPVNHP